jgi:predicted amidohydrolase YtcJ
MGGVKQFFDGVTSIHTAFLKEEYETPYFEGDVGSPLIPSKTMREFILKANAEGWPIRIHTIGDRAIHEALTYYKESLTKFPLPQGKYNTLEHLEVMDSQDLPLVSQEQLVISVQPSHLLVGYDTLDEEVGSVRAAEMFPFNSFLKVGGTLAFGTDTPVVVDVTPIESLYYAVARREKSGVPSERLMPKEVISIGEALYAHTKGAAKALSRDDIGTIAVGKKADFTILSKNLLEVTEEEILETEVVATIFNGEVM